MWEKALEKVFSGRYFATVAIVSTYCGVMGACVIMAVQGKLSIETFLGIFAGFTTIATMVLQSYFERKDRKGSE